MVRRLPVLQQSSEQDRAAAERPGWQWALIGAGFAVTLWLPVLAFALAYGAVAVLVAYGAACMAAGALVGRFAGPRSLRRATLGTTLSSAIVWLFSLASGALSPWPIAAFSLAVLAAAGAACGAVGAKIGQKRSGSP